MAIGLSDDGGLASGESFFPLRTGCRSTDRPCRVCGLSRIGNIPGRVFCGGGKLLTEQTVDELLAVESLQLVDPFAHADETDGYLELVADADHDAALGRTVELRDGERGDLASLG